MEKFETDNHKNLVGYYNDDKKINEIVVPDGVKFIYPYVFKEYNINHVILPNSVKSIARSAFRGKARYTSATSYISYHGVTFGTAESNYINYYTRDIIDMIANKNYSYIFENNLKYPVILQIYFNDGDDVTTAYVKKNFKKFFIFLTKKQDYNILEKLIKSGKFISKRNINTYIKIADEKECHEIFDMLIDYKEENNF
ncbi:MAG: leucine-rich repeat domain-containing protein [Ruminococcus flavefaciens]|nr:leucine-rich repeat domain-containing protein [Ruminococcus flavefaciens]